MIAGTLAVRRHRRGVVQTTGTIVLNRVDAVAIHCCHQVFRAAPRSQTPLFEAYERALGLFKRTAERLCVALNRTALFVCVSEGVAEEMRRYYPRAAERVVTIHNGVDAAEFRPGAHARRGPGAACASRRRRTTGLSRASWPAAGAIRASAS